MNTAEKDKAQVYEALLSAIVSAHHSIRPGEFDNFMEQASFYVDAALANLEASGFSIVRSSDA